MKVALLHFCFEDYTIQLANALVELVELTLIHPVKISRACRDCLDPRIVTHSFKKPRIRDPRNFFAMVEMMQIIRSTQADILHVQETNDLWYDLTLLFNKMPPLVTTIHDVFRHPGDRDTVFGSQFTKRFAFYRSQQLIVHTHSLKQLLVEQFRISPKCVNVLPHGELGKLYKRRAKDTHSSREPYTLLFFGRIWPYKGLRYLLEALPIVSEKIPEVKLIIAGRGESLTNYFPHGYDSERFEVINDYVTDKDVVKLFQRATVTVLPYTEASQSGVAAISYGMGTPVIASNIGGLSEIVHHKKDGLLVRPGDSQALANAITAVLSDRKLQKQMQTAAMERCREDLSWSNIAAHTIQVYHKLMM